MFGILNNCQSSTATSLKNGIHFIILLLQSFWFYNKDPQSFSTFPLSSGLFEWGMLYKEGPLPDKEAKKRNRHSEPYNAPTHAGGLFAIRKDWFKQLGWYDPGIYKLIFLIFCVSNVVVTA